jgi:serpin B
MLILLPKEVANLGQVESQLTLPTLTEWVGKLHSAEVSVVMPKFKMTCEFGLGPTLAALGMKDAFSPQDADFSGMDGKRDLFISAVLHKAFVDVTEEGTEAAAATGVMVAATSAPMRPVEFRADHPFIFLIRDERTQSILFIGRLTDPRD